MVPECPGCGLRFRRADGHWLGSWFLNVCVVQTAVVLVLVIEFAVTYPDCSVPLLLWSTLAAAVVVPLGFFPYSRTLWSAIDLAMCPLEFADGVAPGVLLAGDLARLEAERAAQS